MPESSDKSGKMCAGGPPFSEVSSERTVVLRTIFPICALSRKIIQIQFLNEKFQAKFLRRFPRRSEEIIQRLGNLAGKYALLPLLGKNIKIHVKIPEFEGNCLSIPRKKCQYVRRKCSRALVPQMLCVNPGLVPIIHGGTRG